MKKILIKWFCKPCKEQVPCIEDVSRVCFGSVPTIGESIFYLYKDKDGLEQYLMLEDGKYTYRSETFEVENTLVTKIY